MKLTASEKFEAIYKKDKTILDKTGEEIALLLGCKPSQARSAKREYLNNHKVKGEKFVVPKLNKEEKQKEIKATEELERLKKEFGALSHFKKTPQSWRIEKPKGAKSFSTAVALASDWHYEETVKSSQVSGLNEYDLQIADKRINLFFNNVCELGNMMARETTVETLVLALLGDFISGDIHDDIVESCSLRPTDAAHQVMSRIKTGIDYILNNTNFKLVIPCHSGNHARTTKEQFIANENGHSLEWMIYNFLNLLYLNNKRVQFIIAEGYHSYLDLNGFTMRNHHGHAIRYGGGVGGITIPTLKKIASWNRGKVANIDNFGHLHTSCGGNSFAANGSIIGYSSFSVKIGGEYEPPQQTFYLVNDKHKAVTMRSTIFLSE